MPETVLVLRNGTLAGTNPVLSSTKTPWRLTLCELDSEGLRYGDEIRFWHPRYGRCVPGLPESLCVVGVGADGYEVILNLVEEEQIHRHAIPGETEPPG